MNFNEIIIEESKDKYIEVKKIDDEKELIDLIKLALNQGWIITIQ